MTYKPILGLHLTHLALWADAYMVM